MTSLPSETAPFEIKRGSSPIILGLPHTGTHVPDEIKARLNEAGQTLEDTDWHVHRLYDGLVETATRVRATFSRYVIDANRDPKGASLYPGQNTTTLVPLTDFDGRPIWRTGEEPGERDIADRLAAFHRPYHEALEAEIARIRKIHGVAILFDCHSIRSHLPFLFEGTLPDLNFGTNDGRTCAPEIEAAATGAVVRDDFGMVANGRFRGGWTTRHYGRPEDGIHAIQLELAQSTYLEAEEAPFDYAPDKAARLREQLRAILERIEAVAPTLAR